MAKITFMGAGSTVFAKNVIGDTLMCDALRDFEIALYDIDPDRLEQSYTMVTLLNKNVNGGRAKITKYLGVPNRKDALRGAEFVVDAIQVGLYEPCTVTDFEVPKKYGLRQTIGDTLGIGGIFRALRTIPVLQDFADDMAQVCPRALFLNYTNPMAMLAGYMQRYTDIKTVGLCHSVQGCSKHLLRNLGMTDSVKYPIREKIEKARQDSLAQVSKQNATDSVKSQKPSAEEIANRKSRAEEMAKKFGRDKHDATAKEQTIPTEKDPSKYSQRPKSPTKREKDGSRTTAVKDSTVVATPVADSVVVQKSKSELRRELIDSLIRDTLNRQPDLLAKLLKEEAAEINKIVKAKIKEEQLRREAERKAMLAERNALYVKLLGEARVRDIERKRIEKARAKFVKDSVKRAEDSLKRVAKLTPDSIKIDSIKIDSTRVDTLKTDSIKIDSVKIDSIKVDSLKVDSVKVDSVKVDSVKVDTLAKFDTMTVKQVKAYFKAIYDKEKAEEKRIKQDSLDAKLDRIGLARQAKRAEQYRKWAIRDSIYNAKMQERADEQLRRKLARMEKRGIYIQMADSSELRIVDSILLAEFGPLDSIVARKLDSLIEILYPKPLPSPTEIAKEEKENIDSLYREIRAYSRVKMFRSDFQSVCDSLTMTTIDSIINLHKSPVMWNGASQITSDIMHIRTRNSQLMQADFEGKPLMVSEIDTTHYNQVTGKEMVAYFRDNQIYRNDVNGNVQTIYFMQEDNSPEITLMAYIEAGDMTSYIEDQVVVGITYRGNPTYTFYPMDKIPESQPTKLPNFKWEASRRPTQDSVFTRTIRPSQRVEKRSLHKPLFPINSLMQQRKADYIRRREWRDRTDTLTYETIEWLESLRSY